MEGPQKVIHGKFLISVENFINVVLFFIEKNSKYVKRSKFDLRNDLGNKFLEKIASKDPLSPNNSTTFRNLRNSTVVSHINSEKAFF